MHSKSLIFLGAISVVALTATNALATLTAYEPFNYTMGSFTNNTPSTATGSPTQTTGGGFTGNWTSGANPGTIVAGMTYTANGTLPTANNALNTAAQSRQFVSFANSLSSGTKYIRFLFKVSTGNPGANWNGVYFPNGGTGLFFGFGGGPISGTQGGMG